MKKGVDLMKKYEYLLSVLAFLTLLFIIEFNKYEKLNAFNDTFVLNSTVEKTIDEMKDERDDEIINLQKEYQNDEVIATLEILNTDYKVPIVQGKDNDYYLNHLPNKEYSIMGSIFLDYRVNIDTSKKLLIYGHNSSKYQMPFEILENYYDETYFNNHKYIEIKTNKQIKQYEIFSVFIEPTDYSYMKINFSGLEYLDHLNDLKNKSIYNTEIELDEESNILILQTCSTHKDYLHYKKKYLLIVLKEIGTKDINLVD